MRCPECGSDRIQRDGHRYLKDGSDIQRYLCKVCAYRFSDPKVPQLRTSKGLKDIYNNTGNRQICVQKENSKNLASTAKTKIAGDLKKLPQEAKGLTAQFLAYLEKEGYSEETQYPNHIKRLAKRGADLLNPESVKAVIGKQKVKDGMKLQYVYAYAAFAKMLKIKWKPPKYKQEEIIPFIPDEAELDCLIAACRSKRMAAYLQCLKETFGDPSEVLRIQWIDINKNIVKINHPVKGHLPRQLKVSNKLLSMLNSLPKKSDRVFPCKYHNVYCSYNRMRKRTAELQKNPRLLKIELRTFRHWGGTMIAHYSNGNVLLVKKMLGHKRIENTMKYIGMIDFKDDEFEVATATTIEEEKKLLTNGFDFIRETNGICLYRRPKRFSKYA
jgi:integrase